MEQDEEGDYNETDTQSFIIELAVFFTGRGLSQQAVGFKGQIFFYLFHRELRRNNS